VDSHWVFAALFATGLAAGFVDSIAGGGGLITLPVFLSLGISPQHALGTNKLQATFGSGSAAFHFAKAGLVDIRACKLGILCTGIGALLGTRLVQNIDPGFLRATIPWLLMAIALYTLFQPKLGLEDIHSRMRPNVFHIVFGLLIGFYDGFLGPGTGTFWATAYMLGLGFNITKATAYTKFMNLASNIASVSLFLLGDQVLLLAGITMGVGQVVGARLGSKAVITKGARVVRPVFIVVVLAVTGKLLYENFARR